VVVVELGVDMFSVVVVELGVDMFSVVVVELGVDMFSVVVVVFFAQQPINLPPSQLTPVTPHLM